MAGDSLPGSLQSYLSFCSIRRSFRSTGQLTISSDFVFPTTLLPLAVLARKSNAEVHALNDQVQGYIDWVMDSDELAPGRSYVPVIRLPTEPAGHEKIVARLTNLSMSTRLFGSNPDAYHYILSELIDNIYEHAHARRAYVMAQCYPSRGLMEATFMDDGVTIPGSLKAGTGKAYPAGRAFVAIFDALRGKSAKPGGERGYGLRTSVRVVNELGGEALIVSGRGAAVARPDDPVSYFALRASDALDGTLVALRLSEGSKKINLYSFLEGQR